MGDCCDNMEPVKAKECTRSCKKLPAPLWWLSCKLDGIKWGIKSFIRRHKKSAMEMWVEREVRLAIEREQEADRKDCEERGKKYNPQGLQLRWRDLQVCPPSLQVVVEGRPFRDVVGIHHWRADKDDEELASDSPHWCR